MKNPILARKLRILRKKSQKRRGKRVWNLYTSGDGSYASGYDRIRRVHIASTSPHIVTDSRDTIERTVTVGHGYGYDKSDFARFTIGIERPRYVSGHRKNEIAKNARLPFRHLKKCPKCTRGMRLYPEQVIAQGEKIAPESAHILHTVDAKVAIVQVETCPKCKYSMTHVIAYRAQPSGISTDDLVPSGPLAIRERVWLSDTECSYYRLAQ